MLVFYYEASTTFVACAVCWSHLGFIIDGGLNASQKKILRKWPKVKNLGGDRS
jgi:hypothetical protein